jgi:hypothetical protein
MSGEDLSIGLKDLLNAIDLFNNNSTIFKTTHHTNHPTSYHVTIHEPVPRALLGLVSSELLDNPLYYPLSSHRLSCIGFFILSPIFASKSLSDNLLSAPTFQFIAHYASLRSRHLPTLPNPCQKGGSFRFVFFPKRILQPRNERLDKAGFDPLRWALRCLYL